jgi:CPA1 family monovalent cation:H+ antiporter
MRICARSIQSLALSVPLLVAGRQDIIDTVFGVVLFSLLAQGLTMKGVLNGLDLIGDQPLRQEYSELLARRVALSRVADYLARLDQSPEIDPDLYRAEKTLVNAELNQIEDKIQLLQKNNSQLRSQEREQLQETLLDIEANTYAEFIRAGKLNTNLSPILQEIIVKSSENDD